jgi:hypothetical protein
LQNFITNKISSRSIAYFFNEYDYSPIEHVVINRRFLYNSFNNLLCCLRRSSSYCFVKSCYTEKEELSPIKLKDFKYAPLKLD